jgi:hypothetical protein
MPEQVKRPNPWRKKKKNKKMMMMNYTPQTNEHLCSKAREFKPYMEKRRVRPPPI